MKPIQYLFVGFPYSGKTTLAKELVKMGFSHINIDDLKSDGGFKNISDDDVPDKVWDGVFNKADELIVKYLNEGKNVANEYAWITRQWRDRAREVAKDAGFETKIIYIDAPTDVIWIRWNENIKTRNRFHLSKEELERSIKEFEKLTPDENFIVYDQAVPVEEWIAKNFPQPLP